MSQSSASLTLAPLTAETAEPAAATALETAARRLGFVPNMYGYMAYAPDLLGTYLAGYDGFRRTSGFQPDEQETVFLAVSEANGCDYCVAAHSMIAEKMSRVPADAIAALRNGGPLPDPRLQALATFTRTMVRTAGRPSRADVDAFLAAGFEPRQIFAVILAIGVKTFSNYTNHIVATKLDPAFAAYEVTA
ncbi:carboxymuconolactone decarboxylase family protein [Stappia sp. TSB10GB4]|uniref:carboxymuconolactone decarboxylase family protein n=1 Tax=Stappia sp. TSB10GB4 TaxID=2003584 RepID=UPI001648B697|nr:carboxymuconolactone decarboxylase family protein [Stappia sp. TSB10GB4]